MNTKRTGPFVMRFSIDCGYRGAHACGGGTSSLDDVLEPFCLLACVPELWLRRTMWVFGAGAAALRQPEGRLLGYGGVGRGYFSLRQW